MTAVIQGLHQDTQTMSRVQTASKQLIGLEEQHRKQCMLRTLHTVNSVASLTVGGLQSEL